MACAARRYVAARQVMRRDMTLTPHLVQQAVGGIRLTWPALSPFCNPVILILLYAADLHSASFESPFCCF